MAAWKAGSVFSITPLPATCSPRCAMGRRKTAVSSLAKPPPQPTLVIVLLSLLRADFSAYLSCTERCQRANPALTIDFRARFTFHDLSQGLRSATIVPDAQPAGLRTALVCKK